MVLLLAIILVILGFLVFALRGVFGIFPDNWEWVGIVLAGVGIVMAVPSIFQMILGRPLIIANFRSASLGNKRTLQITLRNVQLNKKSIWRKLGVQRETIQSLEVYYQTFEAGSNTIIQPPIRAKIYDDSDSTLKNRVTLPPTLIPGISIFLADWNEQKSLVYLKGDELRQPLILNPGSYKVEISFVINGESKHIIRGFVVGRTPEELMWILPDPDREDYRIL